MHTGQERIQFLQKNQGVGPTCCPNPVRSGLTSPHSSRGSQSLREHFTLNLTTTDSTSSCLLVCSGLLQLSPSSRAAQRSCSTAYSAVQCSAGWGPVHVGVHTDAGPHSPGRVHHCTPASQHCTRQREYQDCPIATIDTRGAAPFYTIM